jgi:hypothetical protein
MVMRGLADWGCTEGKNLKGPFSTLAANFESGDLFNKPFYGRKKSIIPHFKKLECLTPSVTFTLV